MSERDKALELAKAINDEKKATINGRDYAIYGVNHKKRRKVFSLFTHIQKDLENGDFSFLDSDEFEKVENVINSCVTYNGVALDKTPDHWDKFPEDYLIFIQTMFAAFSYPFLSGISGG